MREALEMSEATSDYTAAPLEENLFEWHFTVRGPDDSDFQVGKYFSPKAWDLGEREKIFDSRTCRAGSTTAGSSCRQNIP